MEQPKVSVIISNAFSKGLLLSHVYSLLHQTVQGQHEIFFPKYQDLSREESSMLANLAEEFPHFCLLHCEKENRAKALNFAAEQAKGKWLLFTESHCLMPPEWLEQYLQFLETKPYLCVRGVYQELASDSLAAKAESWLRQSPFPPHYLDIHHSAIEREFFWKRGGFEEELSMLCEFVFGAKYYDEGGEIGVFSDSLVWHKNDTTFKCYLRGVLENGRDQMRVFLKSGAAFSEKYFPSSIVRLYPFLKPIRLPPLLLTQLMASIGKWGFYLCKFLRNKHVGFYFYRMAAKNTHRAGLLKGMVLCSYKKSTALHAMSSS